MRASSRRIDLTTSSNAPEDDIVHEWLVTNGLGGYASGTLSGVITRRFHGLLIAALPVPLGRTMMLNNLQEVFHLSGTAFRLNQSQAGKSPILPSYPNRVEFCLEQGLPVWRFEFDDTVIEKRVVMPHGQNTVLVIYRRLAGEAPGRLELEPWINFRPHEGPLDRPLTGPYAITAIGDRFEIASPLTYPPLRVQLQGRGSAFAIDSKRLQDVNYAAERNRGYDATGELYSPGFFHCELSTGGHAMFVASAESWDTALALSADEASAAELTRRTRLLALSDAEAHDGLVGELVLAADQFLINPAGRAADAARARAMGDHVRTVIAGYHWFTEWGRDTMISLEGIALVTGRHHEAGYILRTFAHWVKDGLIPNLFPEGESAGLYHTADATLWFFHAIARYVAYTHDEATLDLLFPTLLEIAAHHERGTRFGIAVDESDGLLRQGEQNYQLTWMDAKVGNLVVTPRRGKAVEINALYYNALRLLEEWTRKRGDESQARRFGERAARLKASFNARFWYEPGEYLYDVVDGEMGNDAAFRPNQLFAIALPHPVLEANRWRGVVDKARERLLTPVGLRTLAQDDPAYKPNYFGDLRARDLAYHQGTVWAWLIGPFVDAWMRVYPERTEEARGLVQGFDPHLSEACVGQISEIFDGERPYVPRGCVAQAWSVAEVLRCLIALDGSAAGRPSLLPLRAPRT